MYISMSSALWWVMKGRAVAPPDSGWSTGVSTSVKPRPARKPRMPASVRVRTSAIRRASGVTIRSR